MVLVAERGFKNASLLLDVASVRLLMAKSMKPYTSTNPWKCSGPNCKDDAKFKSDDGRQFYCAACATRVLATNPQEMAAAVLRWIDSERYR